MKLTLFSIFLLLFIALDFSGCDSPTDSKASPIIQPTLVAPHDTATNVSLTPTFQWNGTANRLEISTNSTFSPLKYFATVSGNSYICPSSAGLQNQHTIYFWRVGNTTTSPTTWSTLIFRFTTVQ